RATLRASSAGWAGAFPANFLPLPGSFLEIPKLWIGAWIRRLRSHRVNHVRPALEQSRIAEPGEFCRSDGAQFYDAAVVGLLCVQSRHRHRCCQTSGLRAMGRGTIRYAASGGPGIADLHV